MVDFQPKRQWNIVGRKGGKYHEEDTHSEQRQPQGRRAHQGVSGHDVLQGRVTPRHGRRVVRGKHFSLTTFHITTT